MNIFIRTRIHERRTIINQGDHMNIDLNPNVSDSAPHFRSQYDKLIAERDTSDVWRQFAIWFLVDKDHGVIRFTKPDSKQHAAIQRVARLYDENCKDRELWEAAFKDADKAAWDAEDAADDAAAKAAYVAAHLAAHAAFDAFDAAAHAAAWWAAAHAAAASADTAAAWWAAYTRSVVATVAAHADDDSAAYYAAATVATEAYIRSAAGARDDAYKHMAEKLLELLQLAPPKEAP